MNAGSLEGKALSLSLSVTHTHTHSHTHTHTPFTAAYFTVLGRKKLTILPQQEEGRFFSLPINSPAN